MPPLADEMAILENWRAMRDSKPLVHCITNLVSMDFMANTLLAAGASPAMAHGADVEGFVDIAAVLLINIGTLSQYWVASVHKAVIKANSMGKLWVLDPVGAGATPFRTQTVLEFMALHPTVVRGNASEVLAIAGAAGGTKGMDSTAQSHDALAAGKQLAMQYGCIVAISGAVDLVTNGHRVLAVTAGHELLKYITGAGCSVTAVIAAFVQANPEDPLKATANALAVFGLAAEHGMLPRQGTEPVGPGTLRLRLLDNLYNMCITDICTADSCIQEVVC